MEPEKTKEKDKRIPRRAQSRNLVKLDFSIAVSRTISDFIIRVDESNLGFEGE